MWHRPTASTDPTSSAGLRPPAPMAKRLNRNALLVLAIILGLTAIVVVVTMQPRPATTAPAVDDAPTRPGVPEFLRNPVSTASPHPREMGPEAWSPQERNAQSMAPTHTWDLEPPLEPPLPPTTAWDATTLSPPSSASRDTPAVTAMTSREAAYQRALRSDPFAMENAPRTTATAPQHRTDDSASQEFMWREALAAIATPPIEDPSLPPPATSFAATATATTATSPSQYTSAVRPTHAQTAETVPTASDTPLITPSSPYIINAGTILSGILITSVVSDLPGEMIGQLSHDVYDSPTQQTLLLPKGSKLIGSYDHGIALGQQRLLVTWSRVILPDGRSLTLPNLRMSDAHGAAGIRDQVDNHYGRAFGNALMLSAISAGVQLSQPRQPTTITVAPSIGQTAAGALGQELGTLSTEITRRNLTIQPTLTIRAGTPFTVIVRDDIQLSGPYRPTRP